VDRELRLQATWSRGHSSSTPVVGTPPSPIATTTLPVATIHDDTRFVLVAPRREVVFYQTKRPVTGSLEQNLTLHLKTPSPNPTRLLVLPRVKIGKTWTVLPRRIVNIPGGAVTGTMAVNLPAKAAYQKVDIHIEALWADWTDTVTYETPEMDIPESASLEFATGILGEQWGNTSVEFQLEACKSNDCRTLFKKTITAEAVRTARWQHNRLQLSGIAGSGWRFIFRTKQKRKDAGIQIFPVWANPTVYAPERIPAGNPNVILLSIDTLRADVLPLYGEHDDTTPFADATFGKDGTVFDQCIASASSTSPAHMSMFTGVQPLVHGITTGLERLEGWLNTAPEMLRAVSIETGAVTEDGWLSIRHGFGRGFNVYVENKSANIMSPDGQVDVTFDRAAAWLRRHYDKHFFLFLHTFQVHDPYTPPQKYKSLFRHKDLAANHPTEQATAAHEKMLYKEELRYTDDELKRLFGVLSELGLDKNTVFILISDHGEAFHEHGYYGHGARLDQEVVHVPLLLTGPCIALGRRKEELVGHLDVAPTLLDLFSAEPPYPIPGHSILSLAQGQDTEPALKGRHFYTESWSPVTSTGPRQFVPFERPAFSVRVGNKKLARYLDHGKPGYEFYDLAADPQEHHNLWAKHSSEATAMATELEHYAERAAKKRKTLKTLITKSSANSALSNEEKVILDPAQEEKLRALGYLQ